MKRLLLSLFFILSVLIDAQQVARVTIILHAPGISPDSAVYITGSLADLGGWNPSLVKMENTSGEEWKKEIILPVGTSFEYKYTLGSWEREGAEQDGFPLPNFNAVVTGDTIIRDNVVRWTEGMRRIIRGQVTGIVKYHRNFEGQGILPRDIIVWLPENYDTDTSSYPVVYMHDGQNIIDPETSTFGTDWSADETADSLIRSGRLPGLIIVGIYNSPDRSAEYLNTSKAQLYLEFIVDELKPMIDQNYRTKPGRESTIIAGSSAGGLSAFKLVWEYPGIFSRAICFSPAFKISNTDYVTEVENSERREDVFFYICNGGRGVDSRLQPGVDAMLNALNQKGYTEGIDFIYNHDPKAEHSEADWAKKFPEALLKCLERR